MLTFLTNIDSEKRACGRYNDKEQREQIVCSLFVTILSLKEAPAAAIQIIPARP